MMRAAAPIQGAWLLAAAALLQGCAGTPPAAPAPADEVPAAAPHSEAPVVILRTEPAEWELRQRARAAEHEQHGRLAEAALTWEALATVYPRDASYAQRLADLNRRIARAAAERVGKAEQAAARGQHDAAVEHYLSVLALQPDHAGAADALRALERDYNRRHHLGRASRLALTRQAIAASLMTPPPPPSPVRSSAAPDSGASPSTSPTPAGSRSGRGRPSNRPAETP
jgi:tetratricopeptide (TPR) repeat protein